MMRAVWLSPGFLALGLLLALLVLVPTRRLHLRGWTSSRLATYYVAVVLLGLLVAELRGPARFLVPILVIAYLAPFLTIRDGLARLLGRPRHRPPGAGAGRPAPRNVTPPDADLGRGR